MDKDYYRQPTKPDSRYAKSYMKGLGEWREFDFAGSSLPGLPPFPDNGISGLPPNFSGYPFLERELADLENRLAKTETSSSTCLSRPLLRMNSFSGSHFDSLSDLWNSPAPQSVHFQERQERYRQRFSQPQPVTEPTCEPPFKGIRHSQEPVSVSQSTVSQPSGIITSVKRRKKNKTGQLEKSDKRNESGLRSVKKDRGTGKRNSSREDNYARRFGAKEYRPAFSARLFSITQSVVTASIIFAVIGGFVVLSQKYDLKQVIPSFQTCFAKIAGKTTGKAIRDSEDSNTESFVLNPGVIQGSAGENEVTGFPDTTDSLPALPVVSTVVSGISGIQPSLESLYGQETLHGPESLYDQELQSLRLAFEESQKQLMEQEQQFQERLQERDRTHSERLIAEALLRESIFQLSQNGQNSLLIALEASQKYQDLNQEVPESCKQVLAQAFAAQASGELLISTIPEMETMTLSPSGKWLLTANADRGIWIWDVSKKSQGLEGGYQLDSSPVSILKLLFTPDESWVIAARADGLIQCWNVTLESPAESSVYLNEKIIGLSNIELSPNGCWLLGYGAPKRNPSPVPFEAPHPEAFQTAHNGVFLWNLDNLAHEIPRPVVLNGERPVFCSAFSPDSRWLVIGGEDRHIRLYDLNSRQPSLNQYVFRGHLLDVITLAFCPDGTHFVSGSRDNTVRIWSRPNEQGFIDEPVVLQGHNGWITALALSEDGKILATTGYDRTICLWDIDKILSRSEPNPPLVLKSEQGIISKMAFSSQNSSLITHGMEGSLRIWYLQNEASNYHSLTLKGTVLTFQLADQRHWLLFGVSQSGKTTILRWPLTFENLLQIASNFSKERTSPEQKVQLEVLARQIQGTTLR